MNQISIAQTSAGGLKNPLYLTGNERIAYRKTILQYALARPAMFSGVVQRATPIAPLITSLMPADYQPVACGFYDELEAIATRKKQVYLQYFNDLRQLCQGSVVFKTFFVRDHVEYAQLASGEEVRLDHIIRVDDLAAPGFADYPDFRCGC